MSGNLPRTQRQNTKGWANGETFSLSGSEPLWLWNRVTDDTEESNQMLIMKRLEHCDMESALLTKDGSVSIHWSQATEISSKIVS